MNSRAQFYTAGATILILLLLLHVLSLPRVTYRPLEPGRARAIEQMLKSLTANALAHATRNTNSSGQYALSVSRFITRALSRVDYRVLSVVSYRVEAGGSEGYAWAKARYSIEDNCYWVEISFKISIISAKRYFSNYTLEYLAEVKFYAESDRKPCREAIVELISYLNKELEVKGFRNLDNGTFIVTAGLGPNPPRNLVLKLLISDWRGIRVEVRARV